MLGCCAAKRSNKNLLDRGKDKSKTVKKLEDAKSALMKENAELKAELSRVKQNAKKEAEAVLEVSTSGANSRVASWPTIEKTVGGGGGDEGGGSEGGGGDGGAAPRQT